MTSKVWKYPIHTAQEVISMPVESEILSAGAQGDQIFLWAKVDDSHRAYEAREIIVAGTGHNLPEGVDLEFLGTVQMPNGLVFHVFEVLNRPEPDQ